MHVCGVRVCPCLRGADGGCRDGSDQCVCVFSSHTQECVFVSECQYLSVIFVAVCVCVCV